MTTSQGHCGEDSLDKHFWVLLVTRLCMKALHNNFIQSSDHASDVHTAIIPMFQMRTQKPRMVKYTPGLPRRAEMKGTTLYKSIS